MGTVYKLVIDQVDVSRDSGKNTYEARVYWKTEESAQKYHGRYLVELKKGTETVDSLEPEEKKAIFINAVLDTDAFYSVKITVKDQPAISQTAPLLIKTYENLTGSYNGSVLKLHWDEPESSICGGTCKVKTSHNGIYSFQVRPYVCGMTIPLDETYFNAKEVLTVTMQPFINDYSSGPISVSEPIFCPGYTAVKTAGGKKQLYYRKQSPEEKAFTVVLEGEIYAADSGGKIKRPEAPMVKGPLALGITAPYELTIRTDSLLNRTDYDAFISGLYPHLTPRAMYRILEVIARGAFQDVEDMLYYHCGLQPDKRRTDIRPGFSLRLEQAVYMPKDQMNGEDASGFVGNHTAEYLVSLAYGKNMEYLEFDSFLSLMDEEIYAPVENAEVKPVGAGIIDLCAVRMRQPFYQLQYPQGMYASDKEPDIFAESHVRMIASPGWEDTPLPAGGVLSEAGQTGEGLPVQSLMFRGRSALTLLISVTVNGTEKRLPVGTTVRKLFNSIGVYSDRAANAALYRRGPFGEEAKITFPDGLWEELPLFHGDRIEG